MKHMNKLSEENVTGKKKKLKVRRIRNREIRFEEIRIRGR